MFATVSRSWDLVKSSAAVLRSDKELLVFPLLSSIAAVLVAASFIAPAVGLGLFRGGREEFTAFEAIYVFAFYLVQYSVIFFFNTALVGAAMIRLDGGDPTLADGLRIARERIGAILGYAAIAATVGLLLRAIEQRSGALGRIVVSLVGVAWTLATFLAVPVLVAQRVGPIEAVKQSAGLLRQTWGENLVGNGGIGLAFGLVIFLVVAAGLALAVGLGTATGSPVLLFTLLGLTFIAVLLLALVQAALAGIYSAALYRYATAGEAPAGFDAVMLKDAFQRKL
jgi:hypothetical protein